MCGIAGFSLKQRNVLTQIQKNIITAVLMSEMVDRGKDSWGSWNDGNNIIRGVGTGMMGVPWMTGNHQHFFLHTRHATHGKVTIENAHPFEIGDVIGAHNGIISNDWKLNQDYNRDFDVDSQHIFAHLNEGRSLEDLRGYGAISWIRKTSPSEMNLLRFNGGQLSVFGIGSQEVESSQGVVWASTKEAVEKALQAAGVTDYFSYIIEEAKAYQVREGILYCNGEMKVGSSTYVHSAHKGGSYGTRPHSKSILNEEDDKDWIEKLIEQRNERADWSYLSSGSYVEEEDADGNAAEIVVGEENERGIVVKSKNIQLEQQELEDYGPELCELCDDVAGFELASYTLCESCEAEAMKIQYQRGFEAMIDHLDELHHWNLEVRDEVGNPKEKAMAH